MSKKKFLKGKTNKFNKEERKMNIMEQHQEFYNNQSKEKEKMEIAIQNQLGALKEYGIKHLIQKYLSPLYVEAQKSNEFKQATEKVLTDLKKDKELNGATLYLVEHILVKERGSILDTEKCLLRTCLVIELYIEKILEGWNTKSKEEIYKRLNDLTLRFSKLETVTKCLEKYFVKVDKVEEYVELRNGLYCMIIDMDETVEMYKNYILDNK